jgi:hypothetical protein
MFLSAWMNIKFSLFSYRESDFKNLLYVKMFVNEAKELHQDDVALSEGSKKGKELENEFLERFHR